MDQPKPQMKLQLPFLKELQSLDRQIFRLAKDRREKPKALDALDREVAGKRSLHDSALKDTKDARLEVEKKELDLKDREERRKRLEGQRDQAKTNKEYQAFNFEIAAAKSEGSKIEDEILKLMAVVDDSVKKSGEAKQVLDELASKFGEVKAVVDSELAKVDNELKVLREKRAAAAAAVSPEFMKIYDRIHKAKIDAVALAPAVHEHKDDSWRCGACHMDVNFQEVNVIMKGRDPVICRSCSRMLYIDAQPQPAPAK